VCVRAEEELGRGMKRTFDLGDCLTGAQIAMAYEARRASPVEPTSTPIPTPSPDAMAALMERIERMETAIETLTRTVQTLTAPEGNKPKPKLEAEEQAEAEEPELLPAFASEAPTTSETPPRCTTPDPLSMLSPEQAMLASLLSGGGASLAQPTPTPLLAPSLPPPPVAPRQSEASPARGPPGILSEYGGIRGWMATRDAESQQ